MELTLAASLPELFLIGTFGFWAITSVFVIWLVVATSYEHSVAATFSLIFFGVYLQLIGVDVLGTVLTNPLHLVGAIALWLVIGIAYSFVKWGRLSQTYAKQYDYFFSKFLANKGLPEDTKELGTQKLKEEWVSWVDGNNYNFNPWAKGPTYSSSYYTKENGKIYEEPLAANHKFHIVHWIAYWPVNAPVSAVVFLCEDVFVAFGHWAYYFLGDLYQAVSRSIFKSRNVNANLPDEVIAQKNRLVKRK